MQQVQQLGSADGWAAVARVSVLLVRPGSTVAAVLPAALQEIVDGAGLVGAALRRVPSGPGRGAGGAGELLAVAGDVVAAVPDGAGRRAPVVELAVCGPGGVELALLTVTGPRPGVLPALRACAAVLGLALAAATASAAGAAAQDGQGGTYGDGTYGDGPYGTDGDTRSARGQSADDLADDLADALHDGAVQDLLAARYAVDLADRTGDLPALREALQVALVGLRRALWHLRPRGGDDLFGALTELGERLAHDGEPAVRVRSVPGAEVLTGPGAAAAYRVVQALAMVPGQRHLHVALERTGDVVVLSVAGAPALPHPDRWLRRVNAVGGALGADPDGLHLTLPVPADPALRAALPLRVPRARSSPDGGLDAPQPRPDLQDAPPRQEGPAVTSTAAVTVKVEP